MAWMQAMGECYRCKQIFSFNPERVPSQRIGLDGFPRNDGTGNREPICRACFDTLNALRQKLGYEPWPPPLPGAYEPMEVE